MPVKSMEAALAHRIDEPQSLLHLEPTQVYKCDGRSRVWAVTGSDGEYVIKRFEYSPWRQALALPLGLHPAQLELRRYRQLAAAQMPVVPILANGICRTGLGVKVWIVTPRIGRSLRTVLSTLTRNCYHRRRQLAGQCAKLLVNLSETGWFFRDLQASNIVIDDAGLAQLIDVGSARPSRLAVHRIRMLLMLDHTTRQRGATRTDRWRCLRMAADQSKDYRNPRELAADVARLRQDPTIPGHDTNQ